MEKFDLTRKNGSGVDCGFGIELFVYDTIEEIECAYTGADSIDGSEVIEGFDGDGKEYSLTMDEFIENTKMFGCWGFCDNKKNIHVWYSDNVGLGELISFFAHEMGHINEPHHESEQEEEMKADKYAETAVFAYDISTALLNEKQFIRHYDNVEEAEKNRVKKD